MVDKVLSPLEKRIFDRGVSYGISNAPFLRMASLVTTFKTMAWFSLFILLTPLWIIPMISIGILMLYENYAIRKEERMSKEDSNYYCWKCEARGLKHKHNCIGQIID